MAPPRKTGAARGRGRRRVKKNIAIGQAHIKTSFNNTIVALTDREGNVIAWESAGGAGFPAACTPDTTPKLAARMMALEVLMTSLRKRSQESDYPFPARIPASNPWRRTISRSSRLHRTKT